MNQGTARAPVVDHVTAREVVSRVKGTKRSGKGWVAQCPAHEDDRPSLSIGEGAEGRVLLKCQAGCSFEAVCTALGIDPRSLGPDAVDRPATKKCRRQVAEYNYLDEQRKLLFQVVRYDPKDFRPRRPNGQGGWLYSLGDNMRRVLYHLPEILGAGPAVTVFVVEGEKDVDKLAGLGLLATTNFGGAGKWRDEYNESLLGRHVVILPDNDKTGHEGADKVARSLHGKAASVRLLALPNLPDKGDVSDWINFGGTSDQLLALAKDAPLWETKQSETAILEGEVRETDLGNARRLVRLYGCDLRYCFDFKKWLVWDGRRWRLDSRGEALRRAKDTVGSIYFEARETADEDQRKQLAKWAIRSESVGRILSMLSLAQSEPTIPIEPKQLDTDPMLLNCTNGTLDLRSGQLREHRREDYITRLIDVQYQESAKCPAWLNFLDEIMEGKAHVIDFLRRAVGYSLTGDVSERVVFFLYGTGANGKSVFIETMQALLADYAMRTPTSTLLAKRDGAVPNDVARLKGARLVSANESEEGKRLGEAELKDLTGGDTVSARFMRGEFFDFKPEFKLWFRTNHKPVVRDTTDSIWDRITLITFNVRIAEGARDKHLGARLATELPGILAWAVQGCLEWQRDGLQVPAEVKAATESYRSEMDTFANFIRESCLLNPDYWTASKPLREAYEDWAHERGERSHLLAGNAFTQRLKELDCLSKRQSQTRGWKGIGLLSSSGAGDTGDSSDTSDSSFTIST